MALSQSEREGPTSIEVGPFSYPDRIALSPAAERYMQQLAIDLTAGVVELRQLPPSLTQFYVFAHQQGAASRQHEIDRANDDADRLYAEICRRPASRDQESLDDALKAQKHRGAAAAAKRAAEIRAQIYSGQETQ